MAKKTSPFDGVTRLYGRTEPIRNRKGVIIDYDALPDVIRVEHTDGTEYYIRGEGDDMALTRLPESQIAGAEAEFASADTAKRERKGGPERITPEEARERGLIEKFETPAEIAAGQTGEPLRDPSPVRELGSPEVIGLVDATEEPKGRRSK